MKEESSKEFNVKKAEKEISAIGGDYNLYTKHKVIKVKTTPEKK